MRSGASRSDSADCSSVSAFDRGVVVGGAPQPVPRQVLAGRTRDRLLQGALGAPLRHRDVDGPAADGVQPALQQLAIGRLLGHQQAARDVGAVGPVDLGDHLRHELGPREVLHLLGHEAPVAHHPAPAHEEDLHRRLQRVLGQADHVEVLGPVRDHLLGLGRLVDGDDAVAQPGRPLELQLLAGGQHLGLQPGQHRLGVAREEPHEVVDVAVVRLVVDGADARARAAVDVVEQAGAAEALVARELGVRARAHGEAPDEEVERAADGAGVAVGAEVADALALAPADDGRARPLLVERDGEPRVALVVLEADVVARAGAPG